MNMQKQKPIWSKILAMLCALALCISMVPAASAAPGGGSSTSNVTKVTMTAKNIAEFWTMDAQIDQNGKTYSSVKYIYNESTLTIEPDVAGSKLPKSITFYALAENEPTFTGSDGATLPTGVTVSVAADGTEANSGNTWWLITLAFTTVSGDLNLSISAAPVTYQVSFTGSNFSVVNFTASNEQSSIPYTVNKGDDVTFTLTPNDGFTITQVVANETTILKANEKGVYTISNIQENKSIAVTTEKKTYSISFNEEESGEKHYTLIQGASPVAHGGSYTFSVIPEKGYDAPTVMVGNETLEPTNYAYTIGNITENKTITITDGTVQKRTVTFTSGKGYSFEAASGTTIDTDKATVNYGGSVSFEVVLDDDYDNSNVIVYANGSMLTAVNNVYTINNITVDQTVSVVGVEKKKYTVTLPENWTGYTISTVDGTSVPAGGTFTFTVTPAAGYTITQVTANGQPLSFKNNQYSITVNQNTTIAVTATATQYPVNVTAPNATVSLDSTVSYGNNTFTVTPDAGYKVDSVTFDGATVAPGADNNYTIYVTGNEHQLVVITSPVVEITLTTTVTGAGTTVVTVKTSNDWTSGNVEGVKIVGYGTLYSNQSFDPSALKDYIAGRSGSGESYNASGVTVYNYYYNDVGIELSALTGYTFSYKFNSSNSVSAGSRFGAGWIELQQGDTKWIITTARAVALS